MDSIEAPLADPRSQEVPYNTSIVKKISRSRSTSSQRHKGVSAENGVKLHPETSRSPEQETGLARCINELIIRGLPPTTATVHHFARDTHRTEPAKTRVYRIIDSESKSLNSAILKERI